MLRQHGLLAITLGITAACGGTEAPLGFHSYDTLDDVDVTPFLGTYWSEELGTEYRIEADSGDADIVMVHRTQDPSRYRGAYEDGFRSGGDWLTFTRDARGRVTGFTYSDGRIWRVRFDRR